jgi:alpha-amylase
MSSIVFYFQVHQPWRLRRYTFFDIGVRDDWFDDAENARIVRRVAEKCYLPMNAQLLRMAQRFDGRFRFAFSISGTALTQFEQWTPETLAGFQALARTGCAEFLAETSHHSLACLYDPVDFEQQIESHAARIETLFGRRPTAFRNTELVISNDVARRAEMLGYRTLLGEGADHLLGWRSPQHPYRPEGCERLKLLLRSYRLTDDIAFRFSNRGWSEWPLTAEKWTDWLHALPGGAEVVGLFMDYETFGEHQWADTGIFQFLEKLPELVLARRRFRFDTPSEAAARYDAIGRLDIPYPVSWADTERDLTAWLGNGMQQAAARAIYELGPAARAAGEQRPELLERWRRLTTSDHLYYMCTKWFADGDVHKYFSPYQTPHDAFIAFMNVVDDLARRLDEANAPRPRPAPAVAGLGTPAAQ